MTSTMGLAWNATTQKFQMTMHSSLMLSMPLRDLWSLHREGGEGKTSELGREASLKLHIQCHGSALLKAKS